VTGSSSLYGAADSSGVVGPDPKADVRRVLAAISAAWQERRYSALPAFFAADMVFALPGSGVRLDGAGAVVDSYREFMDRVSLTHYHEDPPSVDVWAETAVASFSWEMKWLAGDVPNHERGHDIFVFRRTAGAPWQAVWRTMVFEPRPATPPAP
jgi:hypothetical protein